MLKKANTMRDFVLEILAKHNLELKPGVWLNVKPDGNSAMPLNIEMPYENVVSVMHTYEQMGDLMRDPDIEYWINPETSDWYPITYRQDNLGLYQQLVEFEDGKPVRYNRYWQNSAAEFTRDTWVPNLRAMWLDAPVVNREQGGDEDGE